MIGGVARRNLKLVIICLHDGVQDKKFLTQWRRLFAKNLSGEILSNLLKYMVESASIILDYANTHFSLIFSAVAISLVLWIPLGILISRNERLASIVLGSPIPSSAYQALPCSQSLLQFLF